MKLYFKNELNKLDSEFDNTKNESKIEEKFDNIQYDKNDH